MSQPKMYRQGDVLLVRRNALGAGQPLKKASPGVRHLLARGEATHHIHVIDVPKAEDTPEEYNPQVET